MKFWPAISTPSWLIVPSLRRPARCPPPGCLSAGCRPEQVTRGRLAPALAGKPPAGKLNLLADSLRYWYAWLGVPHYSVPAGRHAYRRRAARPAAGPAGPHRRVPARHPGRRASAESIRADLWRADDPAGLWELPPAAGLQMGREKMAAPPAGAAVSCFTSRVPTKMPTGRRLGWGWGFSWPKAPPATCCSWLTGTRRGCRPWLPASTGTAPGPRRAAGPGSRHPGRPQAPPRRQLRKRRRPLDDRGPLPLGSAGVYLVNGHVVLAFGQARVQAAGRPATPLTGGKIQLQSEGAEVYFRRITLEAITALPAAVRKQAGGR